MLCRLTAARRGCGALTAAQRERARPWKSLLLLVVGFPHVAGSGDGCAPTRAHRPCAQPREMGGLVVPVV